MSTSRRAHQLAILVVMTSASLVGLVQGYSIPLVTLKLTALGYGSATDRHDVRTTGDRRVCLFVGGCPGSDAPAGWPVAGVVDMGNGDKPDVVVLSR
ncbi:hypothetical protein [Dickeya zeae]|uniref:hypothetical protein n=1 Tax=Dickeya zeae TaxID=204042 RepID=UPI003DA0094B